ncbi:Mobile element protein [Nostoc sphaeroides CCNUC1]|uniref:Mobile element protein n=1 Tax=Nostoc sphaeroides CCNUC1 TaxID=2653204 RepID=A0A5P8WDC0_9NOSO|nr:Mobile element protein [Nostoc sphaeroides CCNUC1]
MSSQEDLVVMDVMESPIERPHVGQKRFFRGNEFTSYSTCYS